MTIPDDHAVVHADRYVLSVAGVLCLSIALAFGMSAWVAYAALARGTEMLERAEAAESAAATCEYLAITSAFDRAAAALELHAAPRGYVDEGRRNVRCELP
jgi:hypothetical protein